MNDKRDEVCSVSDCSLRVNSKGFCSTHYNRWRKSGDPLKTIRVFTKDRICRIDDCDRPVRTRDLCEMHYGRWKRTKSTTAKATDWGRGDTVEERFWSRVNKDGPTMPHMDTPCWEWTAGKIGAGYGQIKVDKRQWLTHQISFFWANGQEAENFVLHHCDNPACVRPDHLYDGTSADNVHDMYARGRHPRNGFKKGEQYAD